MDLQRLFRQIVLNLAAADPGRLHHPLQLAEIRDSIVPYRAYRRALQIETSEDYELALVRLFSGENGLASTSSELQEEFVREAQSPNPDLDILQRHESAELYLDSRVVARVLDPEPDLRFAPRHSPVTSTPRPARRGSRIKSSPPPKADSPTRCSRCSATLPTGRVVNFCSQCGKDLTRRNCHQCGIELEPSWKHCVNCGAAAGSTESRAQRR